MKDLIKFCFLFFLFVIASCKKESAKTITDEISFRYYNLENAGWKSKNHTEIVDNIGFTGTEVPIQYYLLKDMGKSDLIKVDSIYEQNKRERVIEFTFTDDSEDDLLKEKYTKLDYESSVKYMSFKMQNDFYVVTQKKDTIKCSGSLFERNFKIAPQNKIMLYFSNIDPNDKIQLVYNDQLFKKGIIKFNFEDPILKL